MKFENIKSGQILITTTNSIYFVKSADKEVITGLTFSKHLFRLIAEFAVEKHIFRFGDLPKSKKIDTVGMRAAFVTIFEEIE
jgi:hypothetical protein